MERFIAAIRFLTIIPVPAKKEFSDEALRGSVVFFPVVGLLIGAVASGFTFIAMNILPPWPAAILIVVLLASASGGLHMDGLSDTADGFFSSRPIEQILEIMRDSRVGSMGVLALVFVIFMKTAALASLPIKTACIAAFLMPLAGRCALVINMALLPYVREKGLGSLFFQAPHINVVAILSVLFLFLAGLFVGSWTVVIVLLPSIISMLFFAFYCRKKINGATGDTLGAVCELTEMVVAMSFSVKLAFVAGL